MTALTINTSSRAGVRPAPGHRRSGVPFALFLLITATLFIRPAELIPSLAGVPVYEVLNLVALVASADLLLQAFGRSKAAGRPLTACVLALQVAVVLSHASHVRMSAALSAGLEFAKLLTYYALLVTVINSEERLRRFLLWVLCLTTALTALSLLQYHHYLDLPALEPYQERQEGEVDPETGEVVVLRRLSGSGIFGNPNDLARILVIGILLAGHAMTGRRPGYLMPLYIGAGLLMGYALHLTHSRGGLTMLLAGMALFFRARYGWLKTACAVAIVVPLTLAMFGGRQAEFDANSGTGQQRIRLWSEGFALFREAPVFGIGVGRYEEEVGLVAHNSFVQCYVELGFLGGTLFAGAFYIALSDLWGAVRAAGNPGDSSRVDDAITSARHTRRFVLAIVGVLVVGLLTSTRSYSYVTYLVLALAASATQVGRTGPNGTAAPAMKLNAALARRLSVVGLIVFLALYAYVRWAMTT